MHYVASWSLAQTGSGADLAAADAKAAAQELAGKLAMHVVAMRPPYLSRETGGRRLTSTIAT
jgi:translation elongation factor EF-Ts